MKFVVILILTSIASTSYSQNTSTSKPKAMYSLGSKAYLEKKKTDSSNIVPLNPSNPLAGRKIISYGPTGDINNNDSVDIYLKVFNSGNCEFFGFIAKPPQDSIFASFIKKKASLIKFNADSLAPKEVLIPLRLTFNLK